MNAIQITPTASAAMYVRRPMRMARLRFGSAPAGPCGTRLQPPAHEDDRDNDDERFYSPEQARRAGNHVGIEVREAGAELGHIRASCKQWARSKRAEMIGLAAYSAGRWPPGCGRGYGSLRRASPARPRLPRRQLLVFDGDSNQRE